MYPPNLKCIALPVPEIIEGTRKIWAIPGYDHAPFSPNSWVRTRGTQLSAVYTVNTHKMVARYVSHILISLAPHTTAV